MTGYAKVERNERGVKAIVEVKSLNNRFLDINCRLPKSLSHKEIEIRELVKKTIVRGTVTLTINTVLDYNLKPFKLNESNAIGIFNSLVDLSKKLGLKGSIKLSDITAFPSYLLVEENDEYDKDIEWNVTRDALVEALEQVDKYRLQEGRNLSADMARRTRKLKEIVNKIIQKSKNRIEEEREKLRQKVAMLFESDEIDENRLQFEILLLANRLDINEECTRLVSHIDFLKESLKSKEPVGQKINFILQEINREFNTIGSKSDSVEISHLVVQAKEEIEKIREMVQNIE